ncbi:hypothetical protein DFH06DRAFT_1468485 [Mycena polygramma]|nr:hypothetical protein DFH06DRAFT_1468485 [Mycena polygramma]
MAQKRTIRVVFESSAEDDAVQTQKRQRKIAVAIDPAATNEDLAREIASTLKQPSVTLEISGGFELLGKDGIAMIGSNEIVTARPRTTAEPSSKPTDATLDIDILPPSHSDTTERFKIKFVTAQDAIAHARQTPREQSEPTNGVFGFDGELVSGNTTLRDLENEAARVLNWALPALMDVDSSVCTHENRGSCSCQIAQEIERYGLSSTFHCRFTVDGTSCGHDECPYSHAALGDSITAAPPHCSLCGDALAFPCPLCLDRAERAGEEPGSVRFCPLVQNAGCGHLHHAHCVGTRNSPAPASCPSGCPVARFPREAIDFSVPEPHIIIAWDGDKIDNIPVPSSGPDAAVALTTDSVVETVERFLRDHQFACPGLSLRIHFRDPYTESVRFLRSTLVSVCPASSHLYQGQRRFNLFASDTQTPSPPPARSFSVDLHTSHAPIIACGCTPIKELFSLSHSDSIVLYAVKRTMDIVDNSAASDKRSTISKVSMYLADAAWRPSVLQTPRGMAALLSSLYLFAHSVAQKGAAAEQRVLSLAYALLRFPPAIRTLAGLVRNKVPRPEDKTALAEALFHALKDFSSRGPHVITNQETRRFETARIFLAYIAEAADGEPTALTNPPIEELSLVCTVSRKRLSDPVYLDSALVERSIANLRLPGGALYRPTPLAGPPTFAELVDADIVRQLLPRLRGLSSPSTLLLRVEEIAAVPRERIAPLDSAARDFVAAIKRANEGDLVSQGPLELKSVDVVPPRIVIDQEGLLAVFTGRGCGTTRDVNFFRPTSGGDTEVDVNDVSHALQKVIEARKIEDTWQVDCFGEVSIVSRPPDEAVVLCLDLSESMNAPSGVERSNHSVPAFDLERETVKIVTAVVGNLRRSEIVQSAKAHLQAQHPSCHRPWAVLMARPGQRLLLLLVALASKELLRLAFDREEDEDEEYDEMLSREASKQQLACFIFCVTNTAMTEELRLFLIRLVRDSAEKVTIGVEPYDVPRQFVDFRTGDLIRDPVQPTNAPRRTFVDRGSQRWFEQGPWPSGHSVSANTTATRLKSDIRTWMSGAELLPKLDNPATTFIDVALRHNGHETTWKLTPETTTRTLYSLANRATKAMYSNFTLKLRGSHTTIADADSVTLDATALANGGTVQIQHAQSHTRRTCDFEVDLGHGGSPQRLILPKDTSVLAILSYIDSCNTYLPDLRLTDISLWHGLKDCGDGIQRGLPLEKDLVLHYLIESQPSISLECQPCTPFVPRGARRTRDDGKNLTRLHLLKELFTVFLNRAGSFDTAVSLVLGLVTFSAQATVEQELTPIFENFRQSLERTNAGGDTAIYDALDSARRMLTQYRPDLPNLRKRVIIVSDGEDTSSTASAREVCLALQRARVIVDSVQVGRRSDPVLHSISVATGGYRFSPRTSLADALSIFDLETMLFSGERPPRARMSFVTSDYQLRTYQDMHVHRVDMITVDKFPPRAEHPLLKQPVKSAANSVGMTGSGDDRMKRIMREIKSVVADPHPNIDLYFNDSDMSFLKIILEAPNDVENCPYKGATFLLTCSLPAGYPRDPPEVRFVTFIMHPNVSKQGKVCIAELGRLWSSDITLKEIFSLVYGTLLTPDLENPLEIQASLKYYEDDGTYALAVANAVATHASKTRAQWREELGDF